MLCDQLEAGGVPERFLAFLREIRAETHRRDIAAAEDPGVARELERSAGLYARAAERFEARGGDLVGAFAPHVSWTSSATHAVLPLLATAAGVRLQVGAGIASHRERFGHWDGGFWLPECGHAPWLDPLLEEAGVHAVCVDLTDVLGHGSPAQLRPLRSAAGPLLVPIDRALMDLVWQHSGYPSAAAYRNTPDHTETATRRGRSTARPTTRARRPRRCARDAEDFVGAAARGSRRRARVARSTPSCSGTSGTRASTGWPRWSRRATRAGVELRPLDDALAGVDAAPAPPSCPPRAGGAARPRHLERAAGGRARVAGARAELRVLAAGAAPAPRALRELMALQASDWAFGVSRDDGRPVPARAGGRPRRRARASARRSGRTVPSLRNLAPSLDLSNR